MKKSLKVILIILSVLISVIVLDTLQAKIFDHSPLLKIRDNLDGGSIDYIDKGIFVNHYYCNNKEQVTTWKKTKYACPISETKTNEFDFYLKMQENEDSVDFNNYYTSNDRTIYLARNIGEFYVIDGENEMSLKQFISTVYQTFDDSIKDITDKLDYIDELNDGGTRIYKLKDKNITMITCNRLNGNRNIYVGDYALKFEENMCK